ncbi:MAG: TonB family protein [Methylotenera sp.]|nr:TonB family protein [Methylotenera sp.]
MQKLITNYSVGQISNFPEISMETLIEHSWHNPAKIKYDVLRNQYLSTGVLIVALHVLVASLYLSHKDDISFLKTKHLVEVNFIKPEDPPKKETPPPPPPKPKVEKVKETLPPKETAIKTAPVESNVPANVPVIQENISVAKASSPLAVATSVVTPVPPTNSQPEEVTEAVGYAGYMQNPPPEYPASALRMSREGKVLLHVHVLANGHVDQAEIKQSSGFKLLDEAAEKTVKNWTFTPGKRGKTPIDSWVNVPIEFKLSK